MTAGEFITLVSDHPSLRFTEPATRPAWMGIMRREPGIRKRAEDVNARRDSEVKRGLVKGTSKGTSIFAQYRPTRAGCQKSSPDVMRRVRGGGDMS